MATEESMDAIRSSWRTLSSSQDFSELVALSAGRGDAPLQLVMAKGFMLHRKNSHGKAAIGSAQGQHVCIAHTCTAATTARMLPCCRPANPPTAHTAVTHPNPRNLDHIGLNN
jgi:hypothetical protein